ncbi:hypothetical protein BC939DRAFT_450923 [Gamsiella multidivaricata]|uniref:uncharacterized protein n=1 Tax=Gamsiella multidivaricata TaxID=101098 RepID=UPI002220FFDA|nr:uncharacterized protein BC939DRAFT_450923 [Gamsiella multidivaricata]KAI7823827.1 hypothetical protein BC939DRAFT_450923 [Gamsiella multidivaricata]
MESPVLSQHDDLDGVERKKEKVLPKIQREKIIFCIDLDLSMDECFMVGDKMNDTRINRTKQLLKWFIEQKTSWNSGHEFAVMILGERAVWHMDFTSDTMLLSHVIDELYTMGKFTAFNSTSLFKEILEHANLDEDDGSIIRAIMIYTRSDVLPSMPDREVLDVLYSSRRFYYDCIYIHLKAAEVPGPIKPQHVYDRLTEMEDQRSPGYYYELTRLLKKFATAMGELLAHPRVRPIQDDLMSKMPPPPSVKRLEDMALKQQLQQEQPRNYPQQTPSAPVRTTIPVAHKSPEKTAGVSSQKSGGVFGNPSSDPSSSSTLVAPSSVSSPFMSAAERERSNPSSRVKADMPHAGSTSGPGSPTGSGVGSATASGSGTGMDDAILI